MHGRRWRAGDERARQVEQQRRVLVGAGVEALQRDQQVAAAKIRIADQVERRVGGDEFVLGKRAQQMPGAGVDDPVDLRGGTALRRLPPRAGASDGAAETDRAERPPAGRWRANPAMPDRGRRAMASRSASKRAWSRNCGKPARASSGRSSGLAMRRLVELAQMRVAVAWRRAAAGRRGRRGSGRSWPPSARDRRRRDTAREMFPVEKEWRGPDVSDVP